MYILSRAFRTSIYLFSVLIIEKANRKMATLIFRFLNDYSIKLEKFNVLLNTVRQRLGDNTLWDSENNFNCRQKHTSCVNNYPIVLLCLNAIKSFDEKDKMNPLYIHCIFLHCIFLRIELGCCDL